MATFMGRVKAWPVRNLSVNRVAVLGRGLQVAGAKPGPRRGPAGTVRRPGNRGRHASRPRMSMASPCDARNRVLLQGSSWHPACGRQYTRQQSDGRSWPLRRTVTSSTAERRGLIPRLAEVATSEQARVGRSLGRAWGLRTAGDADESRQSRAAIRSGSRGRGRDRTPAS